MGFVIDTNIVSEICKKQPAGQVVEWLACFGNDSFLTSITIEELKFGQFMMPKGKRRETLGSIIDQLIHTYSARILAFDTGAAIICAQMHESALSSGRTPTIEDLMIASIAKSNKLGVATRNVKDFNYLEIPLVNPFEYSS